MRRELNKTALGVVLIGTLLIASVAIMPTANASTVVECYCYNQGDTLSTPSTGANQDANLHIWLTNKVGYAELGYFDNVTLDPTDSTYVYWPPVKYAPDIDTFWSTWADGDTLLGVWEVVNGVNGYSGANQTGSFTNTLTLGGVQPQPCAFLCDVPDVALQGRVGNTVTLEWTAQTEIGDADFVDPQEITWSNMVDYEVFGATSIGGPYTSYGYMDTAYSPGGTMDVTLDITGTGGLYFKVAPVYKYVNYDVDSSVWTANAQSDVALFVDETITPAPVWLDVGWTLIGVPRNVGAWMASDLATNIESDGYTISEIVYWDASVQKWNSYIHGPSLGDFSLDPAGAYFVHVTVDPAAQWDCGLPVYMGVQTPTIFGGWNAISLPYATSLSVADDLLSDETDFQEVWHYPAGGWQGWDGSAGTNFDLQAGRDSVTYAIDENANAYFVLSDNYGTGNEFVYTPEA